MAKKKAGNQPAKTTTKGVKRNSPKSNPYGKYKSRNDLLDDLCKARTYCLYGDPQRARGVLTDVIENLEGVDGEKETD